MQKYSMKTILQNRSKGVAQPKMSARYSDGGRWAASKGVSPATGLPIWTNVGVAICVVLLFHFPIAVDLGQGLFLPMAGIPIVSIMLLLYRPSISRVAIVTLLALAFVASVIALSNYDSVSLNKRIFSGIQFPYILAFSALFAFARPILKYERTVWAKVFFWSAFAICVLGILEIFTPLKLLSDYVREMLYSQGLYNADMRDIVLAGHIRPKVFSSEPSQAAWTVCQCVVSALAFNRSGKSLLLGSSVLGFAMIVFVSPAIVVIMALVFLLYVLERLSRRRGAKAYIGMFLWFLVGAAMTTVASYFLFGERFLHKDIDEMDVSTYLRVIQPFELVRLALHENLWIGVGFGGLDAIWNKISYIEGGASVANINASAGIALLTIPTFTGLLGVAVFVVICIYITKYLPPWYAVQTLCVLCISMLQKQSFVITSVWIVTGIWIWAVKSEERDIGHSRGP